jgi:ammonia channel protein AmtB
MRTVVIILAGVQALTLATVLGYRVQRGDRDAKPGVQSSSSPAA